MGWLWRRPGGHTDAEQKLALSKHTHSLNLTRHFKAALCVPLFTAETQGICTHMPGSNLAGHNLDHQILEPVPLHSAPAATHLTLAQRKKQMPVAVNNIYAHAHTHGFLQNEQSFLLLKMEYWSGTVLLTQTHVVLTMELGSGLSRHSFQVILREGVSLLHRR